MVLQRVSAALVALSGLAVSSSVAADPPAPIFVALSGAESVRVLIAEGNVAPCDSSSNRVLYAGTIAPGRPLVLQTNETCVCVQQTFAPMTATDWSSSALACRPMVCTGGRMGRCVPAPDPTIRIGLTSRRNY